MKPHHFPAADLAVMSALLITHAGAVLLGAVIGWYARGRSR